MASTRTVLKCLIVSPSDVDAERAAALRGIDGFNRTHGEGFETTIQGVTWQADSAPRVGGRPQAILNQQIVDGSDLAIGIFWSRLGTPTGEHESGSVEEIDRLVKQGATVAVYFCNRDLPYAADLDQVQALRDFRVGLQKNALVHTFKTAEDLEFAVTRHLAKHVATMRAAVTTTSPGGARLGFVSDVPDVRVSAEPWDLFNTTLRRRLPLVRVIVENHGPVAIFLQGLSFSTAAGDQVTMERDSLGKVINMKRTLAPGDAIDFSFWPRDLLAIAPLDVDIHDAIRRHFYSPRGAVARALERALEKERHLTQQPFGNA